MGNHVMMLNLKSNRFIRKKDASLILILIAESSIIITGASSGMGKELTYRYAKRGCKILIASRNI